MVLSRILLALAVPATLGKLNPATDVQLNVTAGPAECGDQERVQVGDDVSVFYNGFIDESSVKGEPGEIFDTTLRKMGKTFDFRIGFGEVMMGWDTGLVGLCVGARATLVVPSVMGYDDGVTRRFEVDIVGVNRPQDAPPDLMRALDRDASGKVDMDELTFFFHAHGRKVTAGPAECDEDQRVRKGHYVSVFYTGFIDESSVKGEPGEIFDTTLRKMGKTFDFRLGFGEVIMGWDAGFIGLCVGARATLLVPSKMGYKDGVTRRFEVDIVGVNRPQDAPPDLFRALDRDASGWLELDEMTFFFHAQGQEIPHNMLEVHDKDGDNKLSCEEFSGPKVCVENIDTGSAQPTATVEVKGEGADQTKEEL